ncbi:carbon-nitrogen hydrolase family protein [Rhodococcus sp. BP-316]|jgi:predicted amidohydrolase|uniref:carbon-nitrogen hydrolase family protein n=1 Tax=unclassified Rhodococcus (in: high G+C Gram-positive bacteria) TaxID=192944 RepID=UPI0006FF775B|nr:MULTISPECIES: carbon-nitrogen hydrolase family protein [unclassified Rhodococcus (in: high G+C Gram-positive bacteria)]KQU39538.1 nitrilase [Rhodococcus sp. Leaf225]KQU43974.1 nitrilase [Rhodococcus sp. Leaf258]MBY6680809.1 carbon-nitrogen hydrolase family protein [Rhodococcus sp. BP-316]
MRLTVAGLQTAGSPGDVDANLAELDGAAGAALARGADLLVTPEMFVTGYDIGDRLGDLTSRDLLSEVCALARRRGIALLVGLPETEAGAVYNTVALVDADGSVIAQHRKSHLYGELDREWYSPGLDSVTVVDFRGVRLGLMICYDVEFPENVRAAALAGAHALLVPTAQMVPFTFVADVVIRTRAWENQLYVAYVNHVGTERATTYVGRSSIVGPDAEVVDRLDDETGLILGTVDTEVVAAAHRDNPYLVDRRPGLYSSIVRDLSRE